jgi:hypothetical protein
MKRQDLLQLGSQIVGLDPQQAGRQIDSLDLSERVELVLALPADRRRLDLILLSAKPDQLVQALPPEDFILTLKGIGEADSVELIELSSDEQTTYLADLELYVRRGIDLGHLAYLNELFFKCSRERMLRWLRTLDFEILVLLFERTLLPVDKEALDSLPDRLAERVMTPDGYHYMIVKLGADFKLVKKLVDFIYIEDQELFFALMGNIGTTPTAETEQQTFRWRNGRLADRGWPNLEAALELYRPRDPAQIKRSALPSGPENPPRYTLQAGSWGSLLNAGLDTIENPSPQAGQLANLVNRVAIGDGLLPSDPETLRFAAERVKGYLEIGLALLGARDNEAAGRLISDIPLLHIFQVAWEAISRRAARARELLAKTPPGMLSLVDEPYREVLPLTAARRPLFIPAGELVAGEYRSLADLIQTDERLDFISAQLRLAAALGLDVARLPDPFPEGSHPESYEALSLSTWLLTVFARDRMRLGEPHLPFPIGSLEQLFKSLPHDAPKLEQELGRWAGPYSERIPAGLGALLAKLCDLIKELLVHDPTTLDPRFIEGLWISQ